MITTDRQWPLPRSSWVMRMRWEDLLFAHWPVATEPLAKLLPRGLQLDTYDGQAWLGIVPFRMSDVAPRWVPAIPGMSAFPELNVRTYVVSEDKPGVWFFSLDAASRLAVRLARWSFYLPYMDAVISSQSSGESEIEYRAQRTHAGEPPAELMARYRATGDSFFARPGTLEYWLTARYCLYAADRKGRLYRGEIDHPPWALHPAEAEVESNTMSDWLGLSLQGPPHLLFAHSIAVRAWLLQRCAGSPQ